MSLKEFVQNTEEEIQALKEENQILRNTVHCFQVRHQIQEATMQYYIKERALEETRRIHAEFKLQLAMANLVIMDAEHNHNVANELAEEEEEEQQEQPAPLGEVVVEEEDNEDEDEDSGNEFDVANDSENNALDDVNLGQDALDKHRY